MLLYIANIPIYIYIKFYKVFVKRFFLCFNINLNLAFVVVVANFFSSGTYLNPENYKNCYYLAKKLGTLKISHILFRNPL